MCGLMAGSGKIESRILLALGCLNESRGSDSAGLGWVERGEVRIEKIAQHPLVAFPISLSKALKRAQLGETAAIGHTRAATTGAITSPNAHPFLVDGIAFAHNGIIANHKELGNYEVDSESLIDGIKERNFSKYEGPIALVWLEDGKLHAYRKGNPLWRGLLRDAVYLASEKEFLESVGCRKVKELVEGRVYMFKNATIENVVNVPVNKSWKSVTRVYANTHWEGEGSFGYYPPVSREPEPPSTQESSTTPLLPSGEKTQTLLKPTKPEVLKVLNQRPSIGESFADFVQRREERRNRLKLGGKIYDQDGRAIALNTPTEDWLNMRPEDLCQNCESEPAMIGLDFGEACAIEFGIVGEKLS